MSQFLDTTSEGVATVVTTAKLTPPVVVSSAYILGYSVADWIQYGTLIYIGILIVLKIPDCIKFLLQVEGVTELVFHWLFRKKPKQ